MSIELLVWGGFESGFPSRLRGSGPSAADPVQVDSNHYTVEVENDKVRVLRIKYGPHEKSVMHGHPAGVGIFLTEASCRFTYPDGSTEDISGTSGQVIAFDAVEHLPENLGDQPFEVLFVEVKS